MIATLNAWQPTSGFGDPEPTDRSRDVATDVSKRPDVYAAATQELRELEVTYLRGVIAGFTKALSEGRSFEWAPVVDLCAWMTSHARPIPGRKEILFGVDAHWGNARMAALQLLSAGLKESRFPIPVELRQNVWSAMEPTLDDPDVGNPGQDDPMTLAINSVRGVAVETIMSYARWLARSAGVKGMSPEVRAALEQKRTDDADAVRAILGANIDLLASLDEEWCVKHSRAIFRRNSKARDPAWETYLCYGRLYLNVFRALGWRYSAAVEELRSDVPIRRDEEKGAERLAEHLMLLYWHGHLDLDDEGGLLERFFSDAPPAVTSHALEFVGRCLHEESPPTATILARLRALWAKRVHLRRKEELAAFGWWFYSSHLDEEWALRQLETVLAAGVLPVVDHEVARRLADLIPRHLSKAVHLLACMFLTDRHGWGPTMWREPAREILAAARASEDAEAQQEARVAINRLCKSGSLEYRDLLPLPDSPRA